MKSIIKNCKPEEIHTIQYPEEYRQYLLHALQIQDERLEEIFAKLSHIVNAESFQQSYYYYSQTSEYQERILKSKFELEKVLQLERNLQNERDLDLPVK